MDLTTKGWVFPWVEVEVYTHEFLVGNLCGDDLFLSTF